MLLLTDARKDLRCQLAVVEQVLQRITTAEFKQQTWQVADDSWRVRGVNVARYVPHLNHGDVSVSIVALRCRNLPTHIERYEEALILIFSFLFIISKSQKEKTNATT